MYADYNYYVSEHGYNSEVFGDTANESEITRMLKVAEIRIDELTFGRIRAKGINNLSEFQQSCIKEAVCYQAEYYRENGYSGSVLSYSVPDISVSVSQQKDDASAMSLSPIALSLLNQSGLMGRRF